ncbi:hypothetical protein O181_009139 [Austropuccinia psidii MF-1]|uniref:Uncharacterized protein n=1 Tax=Austropuccinia psidii MF-1 TaxID=1389203 RepID=A0A9Q3BNS5_9BASI|nr:hypothetical protein [Austropuccinia psidii MF-1]
MVVWDSWPKYGSGGPTWPLLASLAYGPWVVDYGPRAVGGLNGPNPLMKGGGPRMMVMARGPRTPWKTKGPTRPKNKDKGLGVGEMEVFQGVIDGRIWPEARNGQGKGVMTKSP